METAEGCLGQVQNSVSFPFCAFQQAGKEQQGSDGLFNTGWKKREFPSNAVGTLWQPAQNILEVPEEKLLHTGFYPAASFPSSWAALTAEGGAEAEGVNWRKSRGVYSRATFTPSLSPTPALPSFFCPIQFDPQHLEPGRDILETSAQKPFLFLQLGSSPQLCYLFFFLNPQPFISTIPK